MCLILLGFDFGMVSALLIGKETHMHIVKTTLNLTETEFTVILTAKVMGSGIIIVNGNSINRFYPETRELIQLVAERSGQLGLDGLVTSSIQRIREELKNDQGKALWEDLVHIWMDNGEEFPLTTDLIRRW